MSNTITGQPALIFKWGNKQICYSDEDLKHFPKSTFFENCKLNLKNSSLTDLSEKKVREMTKEFPSLSVELYEIIWDIYYGYGTTHTLAEKISGYLKSNRATTAVFEEKYVPQSVHALLQGCADEQNILSKIVKLYFSKNMDYEILKEMVINYAQQDNNLDVTLKNTKIELTNDLLNHYVKRKDIPILMKEAVSVLLEIPAKYTNEKEKIDFCTYSLQNRVQNTLNVFKVRKAAEEAKFYYSSDMFMHRAHFKEDNLFCTVGSYEKRNKEGLLTYNKENKSKKIAGVLPFYWRFKKDDKERKSIFGVFFTQEFDNIEDVIERVTTIEAFYKEHREGRSPKHIIAFQEKKITWSQLNRLLKSLEENKNQISIFLDAQIVADCEQVPIIPPHIFFSNDHMEKVEQAFAKIKLKKNFTPLSGNKQCSSQGLHEDDLHFFNYNYLASQLQRVICHPSLHLETFGSPLSNYIGQVEAVGDFLDSTVVQIPCGGIHTLTSETQFLVYSPNTYELVAVAGFTVHDYTFGTIEVKDGALDANTDLDRHLIFVLPKRNSSVYSNEMPSVRLTNRLFNDFVQEIMIKARGSHLQKVVLIPKNHQNDEDEDDQMGMRIENNEINNYEDLTKIHGFKEYNFKNNMEIECSSENDVFFITVAQTHKLFIAAAVSHEERAINSLNMKKIAVVRDKESYDIYSPYPHKLSFEQNSKISMVLITANQDIGKQEGCCGTTFNNDKFNFNFISLNDGVHHDQRHPARCRDNDNTTQMNTHFCEAHTIHFVNNNPSNKNKVEWTGKNTFSFRDVECFKENIPTSYQSLTSNQRTYENIVQLETCYNEGRWDEVIELYVHIEKEIPKMAEKSQRGETILKKYMDAYNKFNSQFEIALKILKEQSNDLHSKEEYFYFLEKIDAFKKKFMLLNDRFSEEVAPLETKVQEGKRK